PDGNVRDLTPGDQVRATFLAWTLDGKGFFFQSNERDPHAFDLYEMPVDGGPKKLLYTNDGGYSIISVSPDRRWVSLEQEHTNADTDIYLYDRTSGATKLLTPKPSNTEVESKSGPFSPDGKALFYTTDQGSEFAYLMRYDLATGERREVLRTDWSVNKMTASRDGRTLIAAVNRDARVDLHLFDAETLRPLDLPAPP